MLMLRKVFNTTVENSVEKHDSIFVSDSAGDGSAFCTGASAGTFVRINRTKPTSLLDKASGAVATVKLRLDKLLVDRGLAASRERAQALIIAGKVLVNDQKLDKAGAQVASDAAVRIARRRSEVCQPRRT